MEVNTDKMVEILKKDKPLTVFDIIDDNTGEVKMTAMFVLPELTKKVADFANQILNEDDN